VLHAPSAYFCKHPPVQYTDDEAYRLTEDFIAGTGEEEDETLKIDVVKSSPVS
jgi:myo-inositol-1-phosphate synthase